MERGSSLYGTMSLLCGQGIILPPKTVPLRISFNSKSQPMKLDLCHGLGSLRSFQVCCVKTYEESFSFYGIIEYDTEESIKIELLLGCRSLK